MLPTFVIGLREGLEASLIVAIIATFLRRNDAPRRGMWIGVAAGVALSLAIGILLDVVQRSLPQTAAEGMEAIIAALAVAFVTGMVLWMRTHAASLRSDLERQAIGALGTGTTTALAVMTFLAVVREGFETSVFLVAATNSAGSAPQVLIGAGLGVGASIALGYGIYLGGVRLNLQLFFRITGVFLILVAAGLALSIARSAHEAGWLNVGQGNTVDLAWLAPTGSVRAALVTGVFGIPRDPRLIEVIAWLTYLAPVLFLAYASPRLRRALGTTSSRAILAASAVLGAAGLVLTVNYPEADVPAAAATQDGNDVRIVHEGTQTTLQAGDDTFILSRRGDDRWSANGAQTAPTSLTAEELVAQTGGRFPVGIDPRAAPGPYEARWIDQTIVDVTTAGQGLVSASRKGVLILSLSGGGLTVPRAVTPTDANWSLDPNFEAEMTSRVAHASTVKGDRVVWKYWVPGLLVLMAALLLLDPVRWRPRAVRSRPTKAGS
jgi:high-affinity iron transporter